MRRAKRTLALVLSWAVIGSSCFGQSDSSPTPPQSKDTPATAAKAIEERPPTDDERIRGVWVCTESSMNNQARTQDVGRVYAVFTGKEAKIAGAVYTYRLDPTTTPRHCDLTVGGGAGVTFHATYEFRQSDLVIVFEVFASRPHPATPSPGERLAFYRFRPAARMRATKPATLTTEEIEALASLRRDAAETQTILEAEKYGEFIARFLDPQQREQMEKRPGGIDGATQYMRESHLGPKLATLLGLLSTRQPIFDSSKTAAIFDVRAIHFDGLPPGVGFPLIKSGGRWRVTEMKAVEKFTFPEPSSGDLLGDKRG